jgi:hypothetical protein
LHQAICSASYTPGYEVALAAERWLRKLNDFAHSHSPAPLPAFDQRCGRSLFSVCYLSARHGWRVWQLFWRSPLSRHVHLTGPERLKLAVKCILGVD